MAPSVPIPPTSVCRADTLLSALLSFCSVLLRTVYRPLPFVPPFCAPFYGTAVLLGADIWFDTASLVDFTHIHTFTHSHARARAHTHTHTHTHNTQHNTTYTHTLTQHNTQHTHTQHTHAHTHTHTHTQPGLVEAVEVAQHAACWRYATRGAVETLAVCAVFNLAVARIVLYKRYIGTFP